MTYKNISYNDFLKSKNGFVTLSDIATIVSGIFMRTGEVFLLEDFTQTSDASLGYSRRIKYQINVEPDIVMPIIDDSLDISFLNPQNIESLKGVIFLETKSLLQSHTTPSPTFFLEHPRFAKYIRQCCEAIDDGHDEDRSMVYNILSAKQSEILLNPKHILSVNEGKSMSFFDPEGKYAITKGMYGISALKIRNLTDKALSSILNSKFFSYLRCSEERAMQENRYARYDSVSRFPIPVGCSNDILIKALGGVFDALSALTKNDSNNQQIDKCLRQIMEMIVFEIYFPDYMLDKEISIMNALKDSLLVSPTYEVSNLPTEIYKWFQTSSNIIRQKIMLLDTRSPELLYPLFMQNRK